MSTVTVVIIRHPDLETLYSAFAPAGVDVKFVEADLGSSFNGSPTNHEEATVAVEIADRLDAAVADLPAESDTRALATAWSERLRLDADEYLDEDEAADDGNILIAGVLYDAETLEEAES